MVTEILLHINDTDYNITDKSKPVHRRLKVFTREWNKTSLQWCVLRQNTTHTQIGNRNSDIAITTTVFGQLDHAPSHKYRDRCKTMFAIKCVDIFYNTLQGYYLNLLTQHKPITFDIFKTIWCGQKKV